MANDQFDHKMFTHTMEHATHVLSRAQARNNMFRRMEDRYWMRWKDEQVVRDKMDNVKLTKSPRARNAVKGAESLLIATDPQITIPYEINNAEAKAKSSKMEKHGNAMWFASGRVQKRPTHYDVVKSALVYSMVNIAITSTKDLVDYGSDVPAIKARYEQINARTPYLFEVWNPKTCYPEFDSCGLRSFYRKVQTTSGNVIENWGKRAEDAISRIDKLPSRYDTVVLHDFYDLEYRTVWVDGSEQPIYQDKHGLPFIPIVSQLISGSRLFEDREANRDNRKVVEEMFEPFLWTLDESKIIERQNLLLTVLYTITFAVGANPMFVEYLINPDSPPDIDESTPGKTIRMRVGERREPMVKQVIDPSLIESWNTALQLEEESTIYRQTLGQPLGGSAPYSMGALMHQAGRLPLLVPQRLSGWAIGEALETAYRWIKHDGNDAPARYKENDITLAPDDIPDHFEVTCKLDISLPQDNLNNANVAAMASGGDDPITSKRWVRENLLNIGQSEEMQGEIWDEQSSNVQYRRYLMDQLAQLAQAEQMAMQPGPASGIPGAKPPGAMPPTQPNMMGPDQGQPPIVPPAQDEEFPPEEPYPPLIPNQEPRP